MPNNKGKQRKGADQQLSALIKAIQGMHVNNNKRKKKKGGAGPVPHFPLAPADDVRLHMKAGDIKLCLSNLTTLFKQGAGTCTLGDSGAVQFSVTFMLPTASTVRIINATSSQ